MGKEIIRVILFLFLFLFILVFYFFTSSDDMIYKTLEQHFNNNLSSCHCQSLQDYQGSQVLQNISLKNTTCGPGAFSRGSHQHVVSFTFYEAVRDIEEEEAEDDISRNYFQGIHENLELMKSFYPDYVMRLYYQVSDETEQKLCRLGKKLLNIRHGLSDELFQHDKKS